MNRSITDILKLIHACAAGDVAARRQFQDEYGQNIYYFPVKRYRLPLEKAGDFYVYVFDGDRIFNRLPMFAGENDKQFFAFLSVVLKHLFLDWLPTLKEVATVPLPEFETEATPETEASAGPSFDAVATETEPATSRDVHLAPNLWNRLTPEEQLDLKLLCLIQCDLSREETHLLASRSGRSLRETLLLLEEVQQQLRRKDERFTELQDDLDSVWGWILLRQKELKEIDEKFRLFMANEEKPDFLIARKKDLEEALEKRYRQQKKLLEKIHTYKLTTPYSDLARLLNTDVGTVGSRICRHRKKLEEMEELKMLEERTP